MNPSHLDCRRKAHHGFTLLELMVVIAVVVAASFFVLSGFDGGSSTALHAGQSTLSNLVTSARSRATANGRAVRLLFHHDPASPLAAERYLRFVAVEELREAQWRTLQVVTLPAGVYFLPHQSRTSAGLFANPAEWTKVDGSRLHSSALFRPLVQRQVDAAVQEAWAEIAFGPHGTTVASGQIVVTRGRAKPPSMGEGYSLQFPHADQVRGLQVSGYGLVTSISTREGF